jgi:hypothetical protein
MLLVAGLWCAAQAGAQIIIGLDDLAAKAKESVNISLDASMLQAASGFLAGKNQDEKSKKLMEGLKALHVRTFEFEKEGQYRQEDLEPIRAQLRSPGWSRIIEVKEPRESVEIYAKTEQGKYVGFAIIAAEPDELAVIYVEGEVGLQDLGNLGRTFGGIQITIPGQTKGKGPKGNK